MTRRKAAIYAGTSGWAYSSWRPGFYAAKLPPGKFLESYATRLNSVEVNYTFRRRATPELLADWIAATPAGFQFAVKAHQSITHFRRLKDVAQITSDFLRSLEPLRKAKRIGPVLFQLPPNFKCDLRRLAEFLRMLPRGRRFAIEFRHESWFVQDTYDLLRRKGVALCLAETDDFATPNVATADFSYFRLRKERYPARERRAIARRLAAAAKRGDVYAYFKHEETPQGALYAEELLRRD
jgi:uncharacterized protein YecE (DUF72 family)